MPCYSTELMHADRIANCLCLSTCVLFAECIVFSFPADFMLYRCMCVMCAGARSLFGVR